MEIAKYRFYEVGIFVCLHLGGSRGKNEKSSYHYLLAESFYINKDYSQLTVDRII